MSNAEHALAALRIAATRECQMPRLDTIDSWCSEVYRELHRAILAARDARADAAADARELAEARLTIIALSERLTDAEYERDRLLAGLWP